jgi:hypothetical protein
MCNPTTQLPLSEAMPLVNALIEEAERNCIDIYKIDAWAHRNGRFLVDIYAYDGGSQALADLLGLTPDVVFTSNEETFQSVTRTVGRWTIQSHYPLSVEAVAA